MKLTDIIKKDGYARFTHYCEGELWFTCDGSGFAFPVPIVDLVGVVAYSTEKTITYMKWIRKHLEFLEKSKKEQDSCG